MTLTAGINSQCIAIIPARGGSRRVPGKNVRPLHGQPLIAYTIEAALSSALFARVVVTTDSPEIGAVAQNYGAEVPFLRDAELADDYTPVSRATSDALRRIDPEGRQYPYVAQLMANCPLRDADDIRASFQQFVNSGANAQLSITRFGWQNPWWAMRRDTTGTLAPLFEEAVTHRSQDLPELFCPTGAVWWARAEVLRHKDTFHIDGRTGWEIPWQHGVDIDTPDDWAMAELLFQLQRAHYG